MVIKKFGEWTVASTVLLLIYVPLAYGADVTITASQGFCVYNQPCTVDVSISSIWFLGRVAMVLRYDNTKMFATNVTNGNFMPMSLGQTVNKDLPKYGTTFRQGQPCQPDGDPSTRSLPAPPFRLRATRYTVTGRASP